MEYRIHQTLIRKPKKYYWEIVNEQNKVIAASENYRSYTRCLHDLVYLSLAASSAKIIDTTGKSPKEVNPTSEVDLDLLEKDSDDKQLLDSSESLFETLDAEDALESEL